MVPYGLITRLSKLQDSLLFGTSRTSLKPNLTGSTLGSELTIEQLRNLISTTNRHDLFPGGRMLSFRVPYRLTENNLHYLFAPFCLNLATTSDENGNEDKNSQSLLTFAAHYSTDHNYQINIDIQGKDLSSLSSHVRSHLERFEQDSAIDNVQMIVHFHRTHHCEKKLSEAFESFGLCKQLNYNLNKTFYVEHLI